MKRLDTKNNYILRIQEAAEKYDRSIKIKDMKVFKIFIDGAVSESAKQYWYGMFCDDMNTLFEKLQGEKNG